MVYELLLYSTLCSWFRLLPEDRCILTPKSKPKNWYERLDEDTKAIVLGIGFIIFVLLLVFVLSNPVLAVTILAVFGLAIFTIYAKYKTGHWWWKTYGPQPTSNGARDVLARNWPIPRSDLRDLQFGGILIVEQIDVRCLLLADSLFRSLSGSPHSSANWKYFLT